jgi:hypothetical protein
MSAAPQDQQPGERHVAPIRWPKLSGPSVGLFVVWVVGVLVATVIPALIVPPGGNASTGKVLTAFAFTVVGVAIMAAMGATLYRRHQERGLLVFTVVPTATFILGGLILMSLKLTG